MKLIFNIFIILLLTFICTKINADVCQSCLEKGANCTAPFTIKGVDGANDTIVYETIGSCKEGLVCGPFTTNYTIPDKVGWVCRPYGVINRSCYNGLKCDNGLFCNRKKICIVGNYTELTGSCVRDSDCTGYKTKCINNACTTYTTDCLTNDDCAYNESCDKNSRQCTKYLFQGDSCDINNDHCFIGLQCLSNGKCSKKQLLDLGQSCSIDKNNCDSSKNLYCSPNSLVCEVYQSLNPETCSNDQPGKNSCDQYHECSCADNKCHQILPLPTQYSTYETLVKCAYDNKCQMITNMESNKSCIFENCQQQLCDYKTLYLNNQITTCGNKYELDYFCTIIPKDSSSSIKLKSNYIFTILIILIFTILNI